MIIPKRLTALTLGLSLLLLVPFSALLGALFSPSNEIWTHVKETLLPTYLFHTLAVLVLSVGLSSIIGGTLGFYFARYDFKAKKLWRLGLILPLAIPSYVYAMIYADLFSVTGFFGRLLATLDGSVSLAWMNVPGVSVMFALALYPYVFLLTETTVNQHGVHYERAAESLGARPFRIFRTITWPLILPGIIAGASLVAFEVLNDYGTVAYFNIPVFSFAIFDAWFRLGDLSTALRIGGYFIVFTFILSIWMDRIKRPKSGRIMHARIARNRLKNPVLAHVIMGLLFSVTVGIPLLQLGYYLTLSPVPAGWWEALFSTVWVSVVVVGLILIISLLFMQPLRKKRIPLIRMASLGYAVPGSIIAVSLMAVTADMEALGLGIFSVSFLRYSLIIVIFAMVVRFLTLGMNALQSGYKKIGSRYSLASQTLGKSWVQTLVQVDIPLLKESLISAGLLIAIDLIKELPLTLMLRPFGFETLSTLVFRSMQNEEIARAAGPALGMMALSTVAILFLMKERSVDA